MAGFHVATRIEPSSRTVVGETVRATGSPAEAAHVGRAPHRLSDMIAKHRALQTAPLPRSDPMQRVFALIFGLTLAAGAWAQTPAAASGVSPVTKIGITSLIGDVMTVEEARLSTGTNIQSNDHQALPVADHVFDYTAIRTAAREIARLLPNSTTAMLAVPVANSTSDPARFFVDDDKIAPDNPLVAALRQDGYSHLLVVKKQRALANIRLYDSSVGRGYLEGIGFYIDYNLRTSVVGHPETARGFIAPFVYMRLALVDLQSLQVVHSHTVTAARGWSAVRNKEGTDPWGAMTGEQKVTALQRMIQQSIVASMPAVLGMN